MHWVHSVFPSQEYVCRMTNRQPDRFLTLSPCRKAARKFLLCGEISLLLILTMASLALAQAGPTLQSATFFGGAGDQRGTGIAIGGGAIYVSGNVQPESQGINDSALVLSYAIPPSPSPVWSRSFFRVVDTTGHCDTNFDANFFSIASTNEGVYAGGQNFCLSAPAVGSPKDKTFLAKFAPDGGSGFGPGGSIWVTGGILGPFFFQLSGGSTETFHSVTTALEGSIYAAGGAKNMSQIPAYIIGKYSTSGGPPVAATDSSVGVNQGSTSFPGAGGSLGRGVTVLNGNIYLAGFSGWDFEGDYPNQRAAIWKYDSNLNLMWRRKDTTLVGEFRGVTAFQDAIYAVGFTGVPNSEDFLIEKYDEAGNLVWRRVSGGPKTDVLTGVVGIGTRMFAVGYTMSQGAGGADAVILEINPANGATLSTSLYGGELDDFANGAATDGTDLYVVGESRSFTLEGNLVGQNDGILLRYSLTVAPATLTLNPESGFIGTSVTINGSNFGATQGTTSTVTFNGFSAGTATSWSDTQIVVVVPGGATTGPVVVSVNGVASNSDKIYTVIADTIAPITTASATPAANGAGWNSSNVTVTLTAMDNAGGSGVQSITYTLTGAQVGGGSVAGSSTSILISTDGVTAVTFHARDNAGNVEGDHSVSVKLDTTPPIVTAPANMTLEATSAAGAVATFTPTATDATSGVASVTSNLASGSTFPLGTTTVTVTATDVAGNTSTKTFTVTVKDTTPPVIGAVSNLTVEATSAAGAVVTFALPTATDTVDPSPTVTASPVSGSTFALGTTTVTATAKDASGNTSTATFTVTVKDTTPPVTTAAATPAANGAGWNNADVTVALTASDSGSGVDSITYSLSGAQVGGSTVVGSSISFSITIEGVTTVTYHARDKAGNVETDKTLIIRLDKTSPTITGSRLPSANANGWNSTNVTVTFTCSDGLSGIDSCGPTPQVVSGEGANQSRTGTAVDKAGNTASATVSGINIDKTPPTLTMPTLSATYAFKAALTLTFGASDSLSGVDTIQATLNGTAVTSGSTVTLTKAGTNTFTLTTTDKAGNTATQSATFTVAYNFIGFLQPILNDGSRVFKLGSTVPVKFQLTDATGAVVSTATGTVTVQQFSGSEPVNDPIDGVSSGGSNSGDFFRYDSTSSQYIFNLSTQPLPTGTWQVQAHLDDGSVHTVMIGLK